jgi:hypothetical protein
MRIRVVASCAVITCAGAVSASAASCVSSDNPSGPVADASTLQDSSQPQPDSGIDASPAPDSGVDSAPPPSDAGPDATPLPDGAPPACSPQSVAGFVVPPYLPALDAPIGCNDNGALINLTNDCFSDASTAQSCDGFADAGEDGGVSASCLQCLFTAEGDDAGYAAVVQSVVPILNVAGCIQRNDPSDAGYQCGQAVQAAWECAEYACKVACPVSDSASRAAYVSCTELAATGVCSSYTQAAQSCLAVEQADGGAPTNVQLNCFDGTTPLLEFFCGS